MEVGLENKARLLPFDTSIRDSLDLYNLYKEERDACQKYRLIFNVDVIASNVLYNMKTEIVRNEGTPSCSVLKDDAETTTTLATSSEPLNRKQAIRDTEYSHAEFGPYVYHCGADIFNNHMLRAKSFVHIPKLISTDTDSRKTFNTIFDYRRRFDGKKVSEAKPYSSSASISYSYLHIYNYDNIMTMDEAAVTKLKEKDGWIGFLNPTNINIPNGLNGETFNKLLNNNIGGEFIDMYPDRTLYSFIPKYNSNRKRSEPNWDYCLTYPYKSDKDSLITVMNELNVGGTIPTTYNKVDRGIRMSPPVLSKTGSGKVLLSFTTSIKHNLKSGDRIRIYYSYDGSASRVLSVVAIGKANGQMKDRVFNVFAEDFPDYASAQCFGYKKVTGSEECWYYIRKYKKLKDANNENLKSELSKLAYAVNVYGDRAAEVVFTDTIDLANLKDNLGRPLTEVSFTVVKNNRGWKEWYELQQYTSSAVTYSHCFGKVTSGYDMGDIDSTYNMRKLHNIDSSKLTATYKAGYEYFFGADAVRGGLNESGSQFNEYGIVCSDMDEFFGDIVEFDPLTCTETILEDVCHRFNTAQRESTNPMYWNAYYDEITGDDYDIESGFSVVERTINNIKLSLIEMKRFPINLVREGYFYHPHNRIKLKRDGRTVNSYMGVKINLKPGSFIIKSYSSEAEANCYQIRLISDYDYLKGDVFAFAMKGEQTKWGVLNKCERGDGYVDVDILSNNSIETSYLISGEMDLVLIDGSVPVYATYEQATQTFHWREPLLMSELGTSDELYDMPFSNGCNYVNAGVHIAVRRQDPHNEFNMQRPINEIGFHKSFVLTGEKIDLSGLEYENTSTINCL